MRSNIKSVQGGQGVLCILSILSTLRNSKLFLEGRSHHDRVDTLDGVNGEISKQGVFCGYGNHGNRGKALLKFAGKEGVTPGKAVVV